MRDLRLRPYHELSGAIFRPEAGWSVPAEYGAPVAEVRAARTRAGMIDLSDRAKIALTGSERVPFLDGIVTADLKVLPPGSSTYALFLNEKSRVLGDARVFAFEDSLVLDTDAAQKDVILRILEKGRVSDDVEFRDLGADGHISVLGPQAEGSVAGVLGPEVRALQADGFVTLPIDRRGQVHVARVRTMGEPGYAIWSSSSDLLDLWEALARRGVAPIGRDAYEVLRIEAGVPRIGVDMGEDTLALEVAPESAISFTKGCYVGQEVVARGTYIGQMRRKLLGLRVDVDVPPASRDRVSKGGREVGFVTSSAWCPTLGWVIAMALLRVDDVSPSDSLFIDRGGWDLRARVHPLPFVGTAA